MKKNVVGVMLVCALTLGGCVSNQSGEVYSREDARRPQIVNMGTIVALRPVQIEGTKSLIGVGAGAIVGGIAGSAVGGGRGSYVAAIVGALAGGYAGSKAEEGITRANGVEITVREDNGYTRAYVQDVGERELFRKGDRVRIMTVHGQSRVSL